LAETAKLRLIVDVESKSAEDATQRLARGMDKVESEAKTAAKAVDKLEKETDQLGKEAKHRPPRRSTSRPRPRVAWPLR